MSASEDRKDELAARALSRLSDPSLPEGLAARIAARATAMPQIGTVVPEQARAAVPPVVEEAPLVETEPAAIPARASRGRWPLYAAASVAAAILLSVGVLGGVGGRPKSASALVEEEATVPLRHASQPPAPAEFVDAAVRAPKAAKSAGSKPATAAPKILLPIAVPALPAERPSDGEPAEASNPVENGSQSERLAHTSPPIGPQAVPQGGSTSIPVYGPPAPTGLGIAGSVGGASPFPGGKVGESPSPRGAPTGSPSGLPGASSPRGQGPRR